MKLEVSFFAPVFLIGTSLLTRIALQGIERALVSTTIEQGLNGLTTAKRLLRNIRRVHSCFSGDVL